MSQATTQEFGKWRSFLWPIHNYELKKVIPMFIMMFFISFNYTVLRDTKDALVVTGAGTGSVILSLKLFGTLPFAFLFMLIYSKMSNKLSKAGLFYATLTPFLIFFVLFAAVLYPLRDFIHPHEFADKMEAILPAGFKGFIAVFRNWSFSLFYIMSELWGSVALSLLFWGFANDIMKVSEAKRFYTVMGMGANVALLVSGPLIYLFSKMKTAASGADSYQLTLNYLTGLFVLAWVIIMGIHRWMDKNVLTDPKFYNPVERSNAKKKKPKMSIKESLIYIAKSKYLGALALMVIAYGISINLIEVTWKDQLGVYFNHDRSQYSAFMGIFSTVTGFITILMMLFVGGNVIRRLGWGFGATVTPVILLITGGAFLTFVLCRQVFGWTSVFGVSSLFLAVLFGAAQNILSKSAKYSLFDPTKEMAYIPLDQEFKVKGKAAVDVVGARFGKSGGAGLQQGLVITLGSIAAMTPFVGIILLLISFVWVGAVRSLNKQFSAISNEKNQEPAPAKEPVKVQAEEVTTTS